MNKQFDKENFYPVTFNPDDGCNVPDDVIMDQVAANIRRQLPQAAPHPVNNQRIAMVCGGPSLAQTEKELVELVWSGLVKVVCLNGSYQWCIDHNIKPSAMIMLDARQFNARFVATSVDGCKYFLASQCHGDAFDMCADRDTYIWHCCSCGEVEYQLLKEFYFGRVSPVPHGTTVAIKAIGLLRMLGFKYFDIFGLDSCWLGDRHHSYAQPENDKDKNMPVWLTPDGHPELAEKFYCAPWMMRQAVDFQKLVHDRGDDFNLNVHGDGLIAATLRLAAKLGLSSTIEGE